MIKGELGRQTDANRRVVGKQLDSRLESAGLNHLLYWILLPTAIIYWLGSFTGLDSPTGWNLLLLDSWLDSSHWNPRWILNAGHGFDASEIRIQTDSKGFRIRRISLILNAQNVLHSVSIPIISNHLYTLSSLLPFLSLLPSPFSSACCALSLPLICAALFDVDKPFWSPNASLRILILHPHSDVSTLVTLVYFKREVVRKNANTM